MYTDQELRMVNAFGSGIATSCSIQCACGRVHFLSGDHGDYEQGELETLLARSRAEPDKYIEDALYGSIDIVRVEGKDRVPHCPCGRVREIAKWIDSHADKLAAYLIAYFKERSKEAEDDKKTADKYVDALTASVCTDDDDCPIHPPEAP